MTTLAIATVLVFATTGQYAFGDVIRSDIAVDNAGLLEVTAGDSGDALYFVQNAGDCDPAVDGPVTFSINIPSVTGLSRDPTSLTIAGCGTGNGDTVTFYTTSSTPTGTYEITVTVTDQDEDSTYSTSPAKFNLQVNEAAVTDTTPPEISYTINGVFPPAPDGENGWYVSDAFLEWTVSEPESPDSLVLTGCDDTLVDYDTAGDTFSCEATSDGGTAGPVDVTIKRDASLPDVSDTVDPATPDGQNGWYVSDIDLSWTFSDTISGIDGSLTVGCVDQILNTDFDTTTFSCDVTNNAGLSNSDSVDLKRDATDPEVELVGGPEDGADYYFGSVPDEPTCEASDATSGLAEDCVVSGYETGVGTHTVQADAEDNAGNTATATRSYTVLAWTLNGFFQPVDMDTPTKTMVNTLKGGSTVPFKFEIFAGSTEFMSTTYGTPSASIGSFAAKKVACDSSDVPDAIEVLATGGTVFRYDATSGQFVYNWQTPKGAGICYDTTFTAADGSSLTAHFKTK